MVKMIPSPDWFVGVDNLNLCEGGQWKQEVTIDLQPYDAGTDSGFTFSSPNFPTSPPENITKVSSHIGHRYKNQHAFRHQLIPSVGCAFISWWDKERWTAPVLFLK